MDINDFRGVITAVTLFAFLGICAWAWSGRRKNDFKAVAELPLEEDKPVETESLEKS